MQSIPEPQVVSKAAQLNILDISGNKIKFGDLIEDKKSVVVFIRHFFCGACLAYVQQLAAVTSASLAEADAQIIVIGCGDWHPIATYKELTAFPGSIYADPSRALYHTLGMSIETTDRTPKGETRKSYLTQNAFTNTIQSIWRGLSHAELIGKQGNFAQLGGEFIFSPGGRCSFASCMRHTEDHVEVVDLMKEAGITWQ